MQTLNLAPPLACSLTPRVRCGGRAVPSAASWQSELRVAPVQLRRIGGAILLRAAGRRAAPLRTSPTACVAPSLAGVDSGASLTAVARGGPACQKVVKGKLTAAPFPPLRPARSQQRLAGVGANGAAVCEAERVADRYGTPLGSGTLFCAHLRLLPPRQVVGASGDLAKKKIFPSLFALYYEGTLPAVCSLSLTLLQPPNSLSCSAQDFTIMGFARSKMSQQEFRDMIALTLTCRIDKRCAVQRLP